MKEQKLKKQVVFLCRHCGNKSSHTEICFHSIDEVIETAYDMNFEKHNITVSEYYILFECQTCHGVSLKEVFSEELDFDQEIPYERINYLYPTAKTFDKEIPEGLFSIITEAQKVKSLSPLAYVILVRKVLEEICKDKGIKGKNLKESLNRLVHDLELPEVFKNATDKLRIFGNLGAHASEITIGKDEILLIEEFLFSLVEYIYILPSKLKKLDSALIENQKNHKVATS